MNDTDSGQEAALTDVLLQDGKETWGDGRTETSRTGRSVLLFTMLGHQLVSPTFLFDKTSCVAVCTIVNG